MGDDKMEMLENDVIMRMKSQFLDILGESTNLLHFNHILEKMLLTIKKSLNAQEVQFLFENKWEERMVVARIEYDGLTSINSPCKEEQRPFLGTDSETILDNQYILSQIVVHRDQERIGLLTILLQSDSKIECISFGLLNQIGVVCGQFLTTAQNLSQIAMNEKKNSQLFRITEKFHASMEMDAVLEGIIDILQEGYPNYTYSIYLSQDNYSHRNLPIKSLHYDSENLSAMQAYVTGTVQTEENSPDTGSTLYAPLKGKQGVYGVLQINASKVLFPRHEIEFISLLANTAGSAIENAQLYHQSKRLISDLQLINEVSHRLNSKQRLTDTVTYMCDQIITSFGAEEVGFILFSEGQKGATILKGSTSLFFNKKVEIYIQYFQDHLQMENEALFIGDFNLLNDKQFRSIMALPMMQSGVMEGFILVMHKEPYHFSFEAYKLLQSLIHHSTLAISNSTLREELERMVVTDYLTKLFTRNYLDEKITLSMKEDVQGTFILIDIDNFKVINDSFGHQIGDEVIIQVANVIYENIRNGDIGARWGGEELAIYLPKLPLDQGNMIADRIVEKVRASSSPPVTISCGVSYWSREYPESSQHLFSRADQALYKAKATGKNKVILQP